MNGKALSLCVVWGLVFNIFQLEVIFCLQMTDIVVDPLRDPIYAVTRTRTRHMSQTVLLCCLGWHVS